MIIILVNTCVAHRPEVINTDFTNFLMLGEGIAHASSRPVSSPSTAGRCAIKVFLAYDAHFKNIEGD